MDQATILRTTSLLGLTSSIWLSGIYFSSSQLTLPILYRFPTATSTDIFAEFYHRGLVTIVPLAAFSAISFGASAYLDPKKRTGYSVAGALTISCQAWTILVMKKVIDRLLEISLDERLMAKVGQAGAVKLLKDWHWMNMVRAGLTLAGGLVGLLVFSNEL